VLPVAELLPTRAEAGAILYGKVNARIIAKAKAGCGPGSSRGAVAPAMDLGEHNASGALLSLPE